MHACVHWCVCVCVYADEVFSLRLIHSPMKKQKKWQSVSTQDTHARICVCTCIGAL